MEKKFKVALVGCGAIAPNHLAALTCNPNVEVVAMCDIKPEKAIARNQQYGLNTKIYTDYYAMLKEEQLDAVHICTPHYLHCPMSVAALENNVHVFLEKPMCINRDEIDKLLEAEKNSKAKICVCFQNRFNPSTILAKKICDEDGGPIGAFGSVFWERTKEYYTESGWRGFMATEGGGVMINQAIHTIDLLCYFLGKPQKLVATKANHHLKGVIEVEDSCEGLISFDSGLSGNFYATTSFHGYDCTTIFVATKNHKIEINSPYLYVDGQIVEDTNQSYTYVGKECYGNGHKYLINAFYDALLNDTDVPVSLESAQYALRILLAAYESNDQEINV